MMSLRPSYFYADDEYEEIVRRHYWDKEAVAFWGSSSVLKQLPFLKQYPFWRYLYGLEK